MREEEEEKEKEKREKKEEKKKNTGGTSDARRYICPGVRRRKNRPRLDKNLLAPVGRVFANAT